MRNEVLPIILGMDPPTKLITLMRTRKPLQGFACIISHAEFPKGTQAGDRFELTDDIEQKGIAGWLQFRDKETMRRFGQMLIDFADGKAIKKPEDKKCNTCTNTSEGSSSIV